MAAFGHYQSTQHHCRPASVTSTEARKGNRRTGLARGEATGSGDQEQLLRKQSAEEEFVLDCGKLVLLNPPKGNAHGPQLPLRPAPLVPEQVASAEPRLVYWEPGPAADFVNVRDLFGQQVTRLPRQQVSSVGAARVVQRVEDVPPNNMLRYVVWRLARNILPRAGRVTEVDSGNATISLGRSSGVSPGMKFRLIRFEEGDLNGGSLVQQVLPVEMVAAEISAATTVATYHDTGVEMLWSDTVEVAPDDVVSPRGVHEQILTISPLNVADPPFEKWRS